MIGASANIVSVGIAKKFSQNISFSEFMKASSDVTNMLVRAKVVLKKNFKLIILKHDFVKTKLLVKTLSKARI